MKIRIFSALLFLSMLCAGGILLFLPYLADTYLFPKIINNLPFSERKISLSKISLWKLQGTVQFADNGQDILSLPGIEFNFSPGSLFNGKIRSILIDGGTLHLNLNSADHKKQTPKQDKIASPFLLPIACDTLIVKNSSIIVHQGQTEHHFLINGRLTADFKELANGKKHLTSATVEIRSTGSLDLSAEATLQPKATGHELMFTGSTPDLSRITYLFPELKKTSLEGQLSLSGSLEIEDLTQISQLQATAYLSKFKSTWKGVTLTDISPREPLTIMVKMNDEKIYSEISNLFITSPEESSVDIRGEYNLKNKAFSGTGLVAIQTISLPIKFSFSGDQTASATQLRFNASTDSFSVGETSPLFFSPLSAYGNVSIREENISGRINASIDKITLPSGETDFQDITLSLPLQFPLRDNTNSIGTFKIGAIHHDTTPSGSISGELSLNPAGVAFLTHIRSTFGPDLQAQCSGTLTMDRQIKLACLLPKTHITSASFPPFLHLPPEFSIGGDLSAEAEFSSSDTISKGRLHLQFNDGTINISENQLSSIDISMTFPDLPLLHSEPSQMGTIGLIEMGNIKLSNAKIRFRIESPQSIFIEKSTFSWCGGKVESGGFRLLTTERELATTLYCDRLNFTQLLSQFGIEDAEGEGSLNGKLPILLSENSITFDDGFLFSTPGDGGIIRFNNSSQLRQGMGAIDQTPYLDYSMQALEDFAYNWVKLTFNSQEEDLLIKMQIEGKPEIPLPFGYKKGHIIRTEKGPGLQHPILLDVNFRLPITHLFKYGKNMQSIMENM